MSAVIDHRLLQRDAAGNIRVGGTRITLQTVIYAFRDGATAEEIAQNFASLQLADVYELLGFYLNNQDPVDAYLREQESAAAELREEIEARPEVAAFRERLRRRASRGT